MVDNTENYILIDCLSIMIFKEKKKTTRELSKELAEKLINKKIENPEIEITFITDSLNNIYENIEHENILELKEAEVSVVINDLKKLRDSNPIYSGVLRSFIQLLPIGFIKVPNPFVYEGDSIGLDSFITFLNHKNYF